MLTKLSANNVSRCVTCEIVVESSDGAVNMVINLYKIHVGNIYIYIYIFGGKSCEIITVEWKLDEIFINGQTLANCEISREKFIIMYRICLSGCGYRNETE